MRMVRDTLGISEVKAKLAAICDPRSAICDRAAGGEVIRFTRLRGSEVERFELRRVAPAKRQLGAWRDKFTAAELDSLAAPLSDQERNDWNI